MAQESERVTAAPRSQDAMDRTDGLTKWVLLTGDRWRVAACVLVVFLGTVVGLFWLGVVGVANGDAITRSFSSLVGGNLTLITIVISVNQLVVSREFGTPAELQDRIEEMVAYRREAEETADARVSPVTPYEFLGFLVHATREHAVTLREAMPADADPRVRAEVEAYVDRIVAQAERVAEPADEPPTDAFPALVSILEIDFTGDLYEVRRIETTHRNSLPDEAVETLDELHRLHEFTGVLRQYLETLYLQRELALFSRRLFYVGIPAVAVSLLTNWVYGHQPGTGVEGVALEAVVVLAATVAFAPLALFFAYVIRVATITRRTAALMPFKATEHNYG